MHEVQEPEEILADLSEEIYQAALEVDLLLAASNELQSAYSSLVGKIEHAT